MAACDVPTISERPAATGSHRAPDRIPPISIHGGVITRIATTESADVALSIDTIDDARLWPALDGTREPVQLELGQTRVATIAHAGSDELVIGVIDAADNASIVRVTRDGAIRGRVAIPGELAVTQLAAIDGGVIAVRADQSIERYDANGVQRGRLVGDPGQRFGALAVRGNGAAILIASSDADPKLDAPPPPDDVVGVRGPFASAVRFIVLGDGLGDGLAWGPRRALVKPCELATLALAPDHRKLAVVDVNHALVQVLDAADMHQLGEPVLINSQMTAYGFTDNDNVAVIGGVISWWPASKGDGVLQRTLGGAVGDHLAIGGATTSLELDTRDQQRFLGWSEDASGSLTAIASGFALGERDGKLKLVDDRLEPVREIDFTGTTISPSPIWIDAAHALFEQAINGRVEAVVVDLAHIDHPTVIASYDYIAWLDYEPALHEIVVVDANAVHRFALDPNTYATTKLPDLQGPATRVRLLDPAKSGGVVAIGFTNTYLGSFTHFEWRGVETTGSESVFETATLLGAGNDGTIYAYGNGELLAIHAGETRHLTKTNELGRAAISDDGAMIAVADTANVTMYDSIGRERWHHELWQPDAVVFSKDQRRIAIASRGGLVELDVATGEQLAAACAYGFGLHDTGWPQRTSNEPTVCEDSP
jgi:hypothetical protein